MANQCVFQTRLINIVCPSLVKFVNLANADEPLMVCEPTYEVADPSIWSWGNVAHTRMAVCQWVCVLLGNDPGGSALSQHRFQSNVSIVFTGNACGGANATYVKQNIQ
jgi:hypothetical protein